MLPGFARRWFRQPRWVPQLRQPRVAASASFEWHYNISQDEEYEEALARLREGVPQSDFVRLQVDTALEPQPVWNLHEPPRFHDLLHREGWEPTTVEPVGPGVAEVWASYRSFHNGSPAGIFLWADGVASCAHALRDAVARQGGTLTDRAAVAWAMSLLYMHELVHQMVEDVVTALEFRIEEELYRPARARWSGYLLMEEALANSFALSLQKWFLAPPQRSTSYEGARSLQARHDQKPYTPEPEPVIDAPLMIRALESIMRTQPAGYRDFVDFGPNEKHMDRVLRDNLLCLVILLYLPHTSSSLRWDLHHYMHDLHILEEAWPSWYSWEHERSGVVRWGRP